MLVFCCRDVDETKDWIDEKDQALHNDNYGNDLASVQALQRKHEGMERDLAALGEKVCMTRNQIKILTNYVYCPNAILKHLVLIYFETWT